MPQAQDIIVQDASFVDKTFTLMTPAAGDGGLAVWALQVGGSPVAHPRFTLMAKTTTNRSRKAQVKLRVPYYYTDAVTGLVKAGPAFEFNGDATVPDEFPNALRDDAVAFTTHLIGSTLVRACLRDGYPAV